MYLKVVPNCLKMLKTRRSEVSSVFVCRKFCEIEKSLQIILIFIFHSVPSAQLTHNVVKGAPRKWWLHCEKCTMIPPPSFFPPFQMRKRYHCFTRGYKFCWYDSCSGSESDVKPHNTRDDIVFWYRKKFVKCGDFGTPIHTPGILAENLVQC